MKRVMAAALVMALAASGAAVSAQDAAKPRTDKGKINFFKGANFTQEEYEVKGARPSIPLEFDVASVAVFPGEKWEICGGTRFKAPCMVVDRDMPNLGGITIQSARPVKE